MSLYAQYLMERTDDLIIETQHGFATYRYLDDGKCVYIIDIYVVPEARNKKIASSLADVIVKEAKDRGAIRMLGSVVPSSKNSTASMKVLLGYGMTLDSAGPDAIFFRKEF